jgi:hypothetical protein
MRFRPRHYVLIVIILALGIYNIVRMHRAPQRVIALRGKPSTKQPLSAMPVTISSSLRCPH